MHANVYIITIAQAIPIACDDTTLQIATSAFDTTAILSWAENAESTKFVIEVAGAEIGEIVKTKFLTLNSIGPQTSELKSRSGSVSSGGSIPESPQILTGSPEKVVPKEAGSRVQLHPKPSSSPAPVAQPAPQPGVPQKVEA